MTPKFNNRDETDDLEDLGIFGFARKTAQLMMPMAIIAGLFGMWLRSELLIVRKEFSDALTNHSQSEGIARISRQEFDAFKTVIDERFRAIKEQNDEQSRMIQKNTIFLERISQRLGIQRTVE